MSSNDAILVSGPSLIHEFFDLFKLDHFSVIIISDGKCSGSQIISYRPIFARPSKMNFCNCRNRVVWRGIHFYYAVTNCSVIGFE